MLFGEGPDGPDLLLTERSHTMRSHPGQVSFPGGSVDPGETARAGRAARGGGGDRARPAGVEVFAELPPLWLPPSNFSVTPVLAWWREPSAVHAVSARRGARGLPGADQRAARPDAPHHRHRARRAGATPGFLIGDDHDVICWGFTAGVIARLFEYLGWIEDLPDAPEQELPAYMLVGRRLNQDVQPNTEFEKRRRG